MYFPDRGAYAPYATFVATPLRRVQLQQLLLGGRRRSFSGSGGWSADAGVGAGYATAGEN